ncbi:MAG: hypothetical protein WC757_04105 [Candidatus Paceibacterota bacterium]|jgi:hypothetical protein
MAEINTPKFLTEVLAKKAVQTVLDALMTPTFGLLKRNACHIIILVPSRSNSFPNSSTPPQILYEVSVGKEEWSADYRQIATGKARQLWEDRTDGRTDIQPHLLFCGDTRYWGGVKRDGIVVACSGVQPWFDMMISGMIADMLIGMAYDAWKNSSEHKEEAAFLT